VFLDFIHRPAFEGTRRFGNWICFRPQVKGGKKTSTQLGPSERANLNHWNTFLERYHKDDDEFLNHIVIVMRPGLRL
jgi:hypothetical protein